MIYSNLRSYIVKEFSDTLDDYGCATLEESQREIEMAIYHTSTTLNENIKYTNAEFIGLTFDSIDDRAIVQSDMGDLKVKYVINQGRMNQVFMSKI